MRKLERPVAAPIALRGYSSQSVWGDLNTDDKDALWAEIETMQAYRCAYCEGRIERPQGRHIEHFWPRSRYPHRCFEWANLFGSCNNRNHCGHCKDAPATDVYEPEGLIKPDDMDPRALLLFLADGMVHARPDLSPTDAARAEATIRVLNLNEETLRQRRQQVVTALRRSFEEFEDALRDFSLDDLEEWEREISAQVEGYDCAASARELWRPWV